MFSFVKHSLMALCMVVLALMVMLGPNAAFAQSPLTIINTDNVTDDAILELDGATSITTTIIGGTTYLFVSSFFDSGVSVFSVAGDGTLTNVDNVTDDAILKIAVSEAVITAVIDGITYLFVAGTLDDGVSVFSVDAAGQLFNVDNVSDTPTLAINAPEGIATALIGGTTYLFVTGTVDDGVSVFSVDGAGQLFNVENITDDAVLELDGARSVATALVGGTTYLFVAGFLDNGVSVFSVDGAGQLTNVDNVTDDAAMKLNGAQFVTTAIIGGTTYLFVAGQTDDGISVFSVASDGTLSNVENVTDDADLELNGTTSVTSTVIGGTTYLFVTGWFDDGVSIFSVAGDGTLSNVENVTDDAILELDGAQSVTTAIIDGTNYLFVAGFGDDGVSVFSVTAPEMDVAGKGISILDGDVTPDTADGTDYGSFTVGTQAGGVFAIRNFGTAPLNLSGTPRVSISGPHAGDFIVSSANPTDPQTPLAAGSSTSFAINFVPSALGLHTATVSIANDDADENPYTFGISGTGTNTLPTGEFLVNTTTPSNQIQPGVATLTNGEFVIAWADESATGGDTSSFAIRAQRFDALGAKLDPEFLVNTIISDFQLQPSMAALSGGGFVITWYDNSTSPDDPSSFAVRAQRYDASGVPQGAEFLVNTTTFSSQTAPSVAALTGGGFVIAWWDFSAASGPLNGVDVRAQRYDAAGVAQGVEFVANTTLSGNQTTPVVAALSGGGFVIAWTDGSQTGGDTSNGAIRAQRFDAAGVLLGPEFLVNSITALAQQNPSVAALPGGGFVIAWQDKSLSPDDTSDFAVRAQRFDAAGAKIDTEFLVNTITTGVQFGPSVSAFSDGGFVITWQDESASIDDPSGAAIRAQAYEASGTPLGPEFLVNTTTLSDQMIPKVATLPGDKFVITWQDNSQSGGDVDGNAIRADIFGLSAPEIDVTGMGVAIADGDMAPDTVDDTDFGSVTLTGGSNANTFTISNSGGADLNLSGTPRVVIGGTHAADFTLTSDATTPVAANGGTTTFTITFDPSALGLRTTTVSITNDDADENPYTFDIQGTGVAPEMDITGLLFGQPILDGNTTPDAVHNTDFGSFSVLEVVYNTFAITNSGTAPLNLIGNPRVSIIGPHAGDFSLMADATTPIATGDTTSFIIGFRPGALGLRTATVSIANDDADENPYTFVIQGTGVNSSPTGAVLITGTPTQGQTLTADTSTIADADGLGPFSFQWHRNGANIAGATGATYVLEQADVGTRIDVVASYIDGGGTTEGLISAQTETVQGLPQFSLEVSKTGLGDGTVTSAPAGINCGTVCSEDYVTGTSVTLTPVAATSRSAFSSWNGDCTGNGVCIVTMDQARNVSAKFKLMALLNTTLFTSILPSARSGSLASAMDNPEVSGSTALGDPITVFASVINAGDNPAQSCQITIPAGSPVSLSYQETDAANTPVGPADVPFDLDAGQTRSFILAFTPTALSAGEGVFPDFVCENANVDAIPGVNTVFLSIDDKEVPDILSIGATPSSDGIITVPQGSIGFMTASAINIGVGDVGGSADTAVRVSADTGAAALPLLVQICETDAVSACITPLGPDPIDTVIGDTPSFFAMFISDQSDGTGVALDPANARAFLRFASLGGKARSVTSAAVTVPAAADDTPIAMASGLPEGRWAVMVRTTKGIRHTQEPGTLYVWPDGIAILETPKQSMALDLFAAAEGAFTGLEAKGTIAGQFIRDHSLFMVDAQNDNTRLDIRGVHDTRGLNYKNE